MIQHESKHSGIRIPFESFHRPRRGLSLIESLVAITTLAIAAALLVPAVSYNRSQSILIDEQGNLRLLAQLMAKYSSQDIDGVLGPVHPRHQSVIFEGYADYGGGPGRMLADDITLSGARGGQVVFYDLAVLGGGESVATCHKSRPER